MIGLDGQRDQMNILPNTLEGYALLHEKHAQRLLGLMKKSDASRTELEKFKDQEEKILKDHGRTTRQHARKERAMRRWRSRQQRKRQKILRSVSVLLDDVSRSSVVSTCSSRSDGQQYKDTISRPATNPASQCDDINDYPSKTESPSSHKETLEVPTEVAEDLIRSGSPLLTGAMIEDAENDHLHCLHYLLEEDFINDHDNLEAFSFVDTFDTRQPRMVSPH